MKALTHAHVIGVLAIMITIAALASPGLLAQRAAAPTETFQLEWSCPDGGEATAINASGATVRGVLKNSGQDQSIMVQLYDAQGDPIGSPTRVNPNVILVIPAGGSAKVFDADDSGSPETTGGDNKQGKGVFEFEFA